MKKDGIALLLLLAAFFSCSENSEKSSETTQIEDQKSAFILGKQDVRKSFRLPAELIPFERAEINAKIDGYIQKVSVDIGDVIKKGQVMAVIDAPEVASKHAESQARLNEANAKYMASLDHYERLQKAAKEEGAVSDAELIRSRNSMQADSAAWISMHALTEASLQIQHYLTIRAPFDGIVTRRFIDAGDFVGSSGKSQLFIVETPQKLRVRVHVPETYVNSIPSEDTIDFTVDAVVEKSFQAKLSRKSGSIDRDTRTELWEYEYENKEGTLKPGMYAIAQLNLKRSAPSFVVPQSAVVTSLEDKFVVAMKNGKTQKVPVREGINQREGKEIFGDLHEGDTLLTRGSEEIIDGSSIKISIE